MLRMRFMVLPLIAAVALAAGCDDGDSPEAAEPTGGGAPRALELDPARAGNPSCMLSVLELAPVSWRQVEESRVLMVTAAGEYDAEIDVPAGAEVSAQEQEVIEIQGADVPLWELTIDDGVSVAYGIRVDGNGIRLLHTRSCAPEAFCLARSVEGFVAGYERLEPPQRLDPPQEVAVVLHEDERLSGEPGFFPYLVEQSEGREDSLQIVRAGSEEDERVSVELDEFVAAARPGLCTAPS